MGAPRSHFRPHQGQDGRKTYDRDKAEALYWEFVKTDNEACANALMDEIQKLAVACVRKEYRNTARDEADHVQEALMSAWNMIRAKRLRMPGKLSAFLYTIMKRAVWDSLQKQKRAVHTTMSQEELQRAGLDPLDNHPYQATVDYLDAQRHVYHVLRRAGNSFRFPEHVDVYFKVVELLESHGVVPPFKKTMRLLNMSVTSARNYVVYVAAIVHVNRTKARVQKELGI